MKVLTRHWSGLQSPEGLTGAGRRLFKMAYLLLAKGFFASYWQVASVTCCARVSEHLSTGLPACPHTLAQLAFLSKKEI